ncbi:hypothetical protein [Pontibacillus litoralis]|uniref:Uncharacterized protein n=1 Tax=Pontibacillus litoralis JSM 072002 TaxID=1385512 RepID=A0A0A5G7Q0_9BACI|nr:hypothetical protein [Pontibacillus litoralis]KGX88039.1 hypothetical protein N784_13065 [Pontibacillus litoralis JSM 072002]
MVIFIPNTLGEILQLNVLLFALFVFSYSIYVDRRKLKATKRMEEQVQRINGILDKDKVE